MRGLMKKIDRFCYKHPNFGINNLMLYIIIGNAVVYLFSIFDSSGTLYRALMFNAYEVFENYQVWRLFTFIIIPDGGGILYFISLYFYYFIGSTIEKQWGSGKFLIFYLTGAVLSVLYASLIWFAMKVNLGITATYLNLSLFLAFATMYPDMSVLFMFVIPIKMKWLGVFNAVLFLAQVVNLPYPMNLLPLVAMLNYIIFCGSWLFDMISPRKIKQQKNTIDFKKAAKKFNEEQAKKPYNRKCEVCGRTDRDFPNLEFRFCSKCSGVHCYCIDHINNHIHHHDD